MVGDDHVVEASQNTEIIIVHLKFWPIRSIQVMKDMEDHRTKWQLCCSNLHGNIHLLLASRPSQLHQLCLGRLSSGSQVRSGFHVLSFLRLVQKSTSSNSACLNMPNKDKSESTEDESFYNYVCVSSGSRAPKFVCIYTE